MPSFVSEVRTATVGHLWCHSPFVFFAWASESWWVLTLQHSCSHLAYGCWFCPQHESGNMLSERTWDLTNPFFLRIVKSVLCVVCLVQRLYVKGEKYGCFAAVFSRRKVPALDVTARDLTSVFLGACFLFFMSNSASFVFHGPMLVVARFHTAIRVRFRLQHILFNIRFFSRLFVLAKVVYLNTTHRFADTVRCRGRGHMVDRVASKGSSRCSASPKEVPWFFVRLVSPHVLHNCCRLSCSALERRSSKLGGRARSSFATRLPNRNTSRLLGRGMVCELGLRAMRAHRN